MSSRYQELLAREKKFNQKLAEQSKAHSAGNSAKKQEEEEDMPVGAEPETPEQDKFSNEQQEKEATTLRTQSPANMPKTPPAQSSMR